MTSLQPAGPESGSADEASQAFPSDFDSVSPAYDPHGIQPAEPDPGADLGFDSAGDAPGAETPPADEESAAPAAKKARRRSPSRKKSKTSKRAQASEPVADGDGAGSETDPAALLELASEPLSDPLSEALPRSAAELELAEGRGAAAADSPAPYPAAEPAEMEAADNRRSERRRAQPKRRSGADGFDLAVPIEPAAEPESAPAARLARGRRGRTLPPLASPAVAEFSGAVQRAAPAGERDPQGSVGAGRPAAPPDADLLEAGSGDEPDPLGHSRRRRRARRAWGQHAEAGPRAELGDGTGSPRRAPDGEASAFRRGSAGSVAPEVDPADPDEPQFPRDPQDFEHDPAGAAGRSAWQSEAPAERGTAPRRAPWGAPRSGAPLPADPYAGGEDGEPEGAELGDAGLEAGPSGDSGRDAEGGRRGRRRGGRRRRERRERSRLLGDPGQTAESPARFPSDPADPVSQSASFAVAIEAIPGEDDPDLLPWTADPLAPAPAPADPIGSGELDGAGEVGGRRRRRRGRGRNGTAEAVHPLAPRKLPEVPRDQTILVNAADPEETRVVVVEKGSIVDLQMTVEKHKSYVNDIYRGRVVNLESAIGAAFVDFGQGRNGFLHASDVMDFYGDDDFALERLLTARTEASDWEAKGVQAEEVEEPAGGEARASDEDKRGLRPKRGSAAQKSRRVKRRNITDLLEKGQLVVVQITKDAIGDKGPTLTTYISIPGRYLVLMPSLQRTGVSRKIEDERERRRLKKILQEMEIPEGMGVIVRTAGVGKTSEEIKRDLDYLLAVWDDFSKQLVLGRMPAPLYQESDVAIRTMRDLFSTRTEAVIVDDPKVYEQMLEFTRRLMPEHVERVRLHESTKPLFHAYGVEQDFERIFARRVELPSGGSIVIDQTEALVAIDVNSGRTRDEGADFEDIALKTNLEAAPEIARQIKLRDMGGILVVDFIDMLRPSSRRQVEKVFAECLDQDRARSKVGRISQFGLLELTRQRLGPGLSKLVYEACPTCKGSGRRRTAQSRAQAVLRRLASALNQKGFTRIDVLAHPDTIHWLEEHDKDELEQLRESFKREIVLREVENQSEDSVFHYLRADGREVRPGGRRKR